MMIYESFCQKLHPGAAQQTYLIPLSPNSHNNQLMHVHDETASGPSALSTGCSFHSDPVYLA